MAPTQTPDPTPNRPNCPHCGKAMSILRYANAQKGRADLVAYHCTEHGRFWMHSGQLRQEGPYPQDTEG